LEKIASCKSLKPEFLLPGCKLSRSSCKLKAIMYYIL
jgi:hypothetical protein